MSTFAGKGGYAMIDGTMVSEINEWSLTVSADQLEDTVFESGGVEWRTFKQGIKEWSGSYTGFWDLTDTDGQTALHNALKNDTVIEAYFHITGNYYYWGDANVEGEDPGVVYDDIADISFDLQGSGKLDENLT